MINKLQNRLGPVAVVGMAAFVMLAVSACGASKTRQEYGSTAQPGGPCLLQASHLVDQAFGDAKERLQDAGCQRYFDDYFDTLLESAAGDPGPENKQRFADFLEWSIERGVISNTQGKIRFTRYFHGTYASLPNDRSTCLATRQKGRVVRDLGEELKQKQAGLLKAVDDKQAWQTAKVNYNDLVFLIEATRLACEAES